jgi:cardiolipin synthase (CMP-forming)
MVIAHHPWAWWTFFAGAVSDAFDGYLARVLKVQSQIGQSLDPLADKLYVTGVTVAWAVEGRFPAWLLAIVLGRDAMILAGSALIYRKTGRRDFQPSVWGKLSTILQLCALGACFLLSDAALNRWLWACALATLVSGADYARIGWAMWKRS